MAWDIDQAAEVLALLGRDDLRDNRIHELWKSYFVDRQVHGALTTLFGGKEPPRELVSLILRQAPDLSRADIRASLMRARASFDFPITVPLAGTRPTTSTPSSAPPADLHQPSRPPVPASSATSSRRVTVSAAERALTLRDLINAGMLSPGQPLTAEWRHQLRQAELLPDGSVRVKGKTYASPSAAGEAVKIDIAGGDLKDTTRATDGWEFWKAPDPTNGHPVRLKELRRRLAQRSAT